MTNPPLIKRNRKDRILNNVKQLYNKYFNTFKKKYDSQNLNKRDEIFFGRNKFKMLGKQKSEWTEVKTEREMWKPIRFKIIRKEFDEKNKREMQKPIWFEINKKEIQELARHIYKNEDNNDFKIVINKKTDNLKNAKNFWMEVTPCKTTKSEAKKLHNKLTRKDIDALER